MDTYCVRPFRPEERPAGSRHLATGRPGDRDCSSVQRLPTPLVTTPQTVHSFTSEA